ncbi:MAG TPA: hypothetical protein VF297_16030 [Pyrinomonadaceae bacterium]
MLRLVFDIERRWGGNWCVLGVSFPLLSFSFGFNVASERGLRFSNCFRR